MPFESKICTVNPHIPQYITTVTFENVLLWSVLHSVCRRVINFLTDTSLDIHIFNCRGYVCSHPHSIGYKHMTAPLNPLGFLYLFTYVEVRYHIQMMRWEKNIGLSCIDLWLNRIPNYTDGDTLPETSHHTITYQRVFNHLKVFFARTLDWKVHLMTSTTVNVLHEEVQSSCSGGAAPLLHSHYKNQFSPPSELSGSRPHLPHSRAHRSKRKGTSSNQHGGLPPVCFCLSPKQTLPNNFARYVHQGALPQSQTNPWCTWVYSTTCTVSSFLSCAAGTAIVWILWGVHYSH